MGFLTRLRSAYIIVKFRLRGVYVAYGSVIMGDVKIGRYTRINAKSHLQSCQIGSCCAIAGRLIVRDSDHLTCYLNMQEYFQRTVLSSNIKVAGHKKGDIVIGNGVWIGDSVVVLSGVHIGDGAVIGAGSVVTKSIPPYAIAVGNPAKVIKYRFDKEVIEIVSKIDWWNWDRNKLVKNRSLFEQNFAEINAKEVTEIVDSIQS
jgi:virginiamycin A acetyltransferase